MGATAAVHPTDPILQAFGLGKLDDVSSTSVSKHLEGCDRCQRRVAELSSDEFLGRLQKAQVKPDKATSGWSPSAASSTEGASRPVAAPPPVDTLPPELVDHPDYEIVRELGRGGMGVVYLANNRLMGRLEVLKVIGRHLVERPGVLDHFLREIRSAAMLHHANIVTAYTAMRLGSSVVLAMEYVEGLDLAKMVKTKGPLPVAHACYFIHQAALGLQHAHERGMVHRDIKPANLILARDGKKAIVKVFDFGLAKVTSEGQTDSGLTREGQMLGTPDYIAPEQIRNAQSADIRADIYSLGCTFYYLLSGGPPFRGEHLWDVYQAHFSMEAGPLNLIRPEVPVELAAVVAKMMAKEPGRRFQTPGEVSRALTPFFKPAVRHPAGSSSEMPRVNSPVARAPTSSVSLSPTRRATASPASSLTMREPSKRAADDVPWESLIEFEETERSEAPVITKPNSPKTSPVPGPVRRPPWLWPAAAGLLLLGLVVAWAVVFKVRTEKGELVFSDLPERAVVTVDGRVTTVEWPGGKGPARVTVGTGDHEVKVELDGAEIQGEEVKIAAGDKKWISVRFESRTAAPNAEEGLAPKRASDAGYRPFDPTQFTILDGSWELKEEELVQADANARWPLLMFGDERWTDYDFTTDFMRLEGPADMSLVVRCTDEKDNLRFAASGKGGWKYCFVQATEPGQHRYLTGVEFPIVSHKWYTGRVRVRGSHIVCTLKDAEKELVRLELDDDRHPNGRVGLRTWYSAYRFKNIRVTDPFGKLLWAGSPAIGRPYQKHEGEPSTNSTDQNHFVSLFNGRDLTGWNADRGDPNVWRVINGVLVANPEGGRRELSYLLSEQEYSDFILRFRFQLPPNTNSGVSFRALPGEQPFHLEVSLRSFADGLAPTAALGWTSTGNAADFLLPDQAAVLGPPDAWNQMEIHHQGDALSVFVNRQRASSFDLHKLEASPGALPGLKRRSGRIGFQSVAGTARFRDIEIKEVAPRRAPPTPHP
jgi:serine/threonine protein kinase